MGSISREPGRPTVVNRPFAGRTVLPMKAVPGELVDTDQWVHELKWDGMRGVVFIDDEGIRVQSANGNDATSSFPELDGLVDALAAFGPIILDGEIVAAGDDGRPSFHHLQRRMHVSDPAEAIRRAAQVPVTFVAFDVLHLGGHDTFGLPWDDRRALLEQVLEPGSSWRCADVHRDGAASLLEAVIERELEGIVSKQRSSTYHQGKRSPVWRKIKPRLRQEFVVGGWATGRDGRTGSVGSLILGVHDDDGTLRHVGSVGSGFDGETLNAWELRALADARSTSPFNGPVPPSPGRQHRWLEPIHVVEVAFGEWTDDGHLRHPSHLGLRVDKDPREVVRET